MLSQRSRSVREGRVARRLVGPVALTAVATLTGCSIFGGTDGANAGPPRISPPPQSEVAAAMINDKTENSTRLNACELLNLSSAKVISLTGADMPEIDPTESGDLGMLCTYGGPGSTERYEAKQEAEQEAKEAAESSTASSLSVTATTLPDGTTTPTSTSTSTSPSPSSSAAETEAEAKAEAEADTVPDTFAAGAVKPVGGPSAALAGQPVLLGNRYSCSEVRGSTATSIADAGAGVPEAPAPVRPDLTTAYIDCLAAPAGGGVEVHTIFIADNDLWHLTLAKPGTPRSPEADAEALTGLHKVAEHVLD